MFKLTLRLETFGASFHQTSRFFRINRRGQASICPFALREVSVLTELALGHLRYHLTDVPPQSKLPGQIRVPRRESLGKQSRLIAEK